MAGMRGEIRGPLQATLVGLVDTPQQHEQLMHACRALSGKAGQNLLHKETVYKPSAFANPGSRMNYQLLLRLGKITTSPDSADKYVQPMSLLWVSDMIQFPQEYEKYLRASESKLRRLPKPSLRKMIDVEVSYTSEEMLRLLGFEVDYSFIRSGHQFSLGPHGRTTIRISEIHRFQKDTNPNQQQAQKPTSKLEVDAQGADVPDVYLVELIGVSGDDTAKSQEAAVQEVLQHADKLWAYVAFNSADEYLQTLMGHGIPGAAYAAGAFMKP